MSSGKWRTFCLGLNVSTQWGLSIMVNTLQTTYSNTYSWENNLVLSFNKLNIWQDSFLTLIWLLTHSGRLTDICVGNLTIIGSDNGLSPGRRQAIIWTNAGILLIWPLGTNFSEKLIEIRTVSLKKMRLKGSSAKWRPFCLGLNVF